MLKDFLKANGLALESEELLPEVIQNDVQAVVDDVEEANTSADEVVATDDAAVALESLVATLESCGGAKTALEKHLVMTQAAMLYKSMGLAAPVVPTLESADSFELSLESFKETAQKVVAAIKAAWQKLVKMFKDLWARIGDTAGRLHKKLSAKLKETEKTTVSFKSPMLNPSTETVNDSNLNAVFTRNDVKETIEFSDNFMRNLAEKMKAGMSDAVGQVIADLDKKQANQASETKEVTFELTVSKAGLVFLNQLNQVSKYHRDWAGRNARKEALLNEYTEALKKSSIDSDAYPEWFLRKVANAIMKAARMEERVMTGYSAQTIRVANKFMATL